MARIVPAKPASATVAEEAALLALEAGLDDSHVILQRAPVPGTLLVAHPDFGLCAVACLTGARTFDPDDETWQGADLAELGRAATAANRTPGCGPVSVAAFLADTAPPKARTANSLLAFAGESSLLSNLVSSALSANPVVIGDHAIDAMIQADSPGAAAYARGTVTEAQRRWRGVSPDAETLSDAFGAAMASALPASSMVPQVPFITGDDPIILLLRQAAETVAAGRPIFVQGIEIDALELTEPDFLLPALLVAAAEDWAPVVVQRQGRGGFHMRLRTDRDSILGYRLVSIEPSAPLLLMLPVVDRIRRAARQMPDGREEISMDETLRSFGRWLSANRLDAEMMEEIDMRIALQAK